MMSPRRRKVLPPSVVLYGLTLYMPASQKIAGLRGSNASHVGRLGTRSDNVVSVRRVHVVPVVLTQRPRAATPAITISEPGTADTMVRLPHSEILYASVPVTF